MIPPPDGIPQPNEIPPPDGILQPNEIPPPDGISKPNEIPSPDEAVIRQNSSKDAFTFSYGALIMLAVHGKIYRNEWHIMKTIDLHCDTIMKFWMGKKLADMQGTHINLPKLKAGQAGVQCFAIFIPTHGATKYLDGYTTADEYFDRAYKRFLEEMDENSADIGQVFTVRDIEENLRRGRISALLTVEDSVLLRGDLRVLDDYYRMGVRMMTLTWNYENSLGYPHNSDPALHALGLKPFGIEAVQRMNELGIIVDVSHLSEGGFWDVAKNSRSPFIASHSCARSLCDVSRNLTDEQLRAVAQSGGVIGVNYYTEFVRPMKNEQDLHTSIEDVARHLVHMRNVAGIDALALGSDYDGMESTMEWGDCGGTQQLLDGLSKEFTTSELEKIASGNALRVFREVLR